MCCGSYNIVLICHIYTYINIPVHTYTHTHTHTHAKFTFFNENIRSNKDSEQIERNKLKYLHYLNKLIKKMYDEEVHFQRTFMLLARIISKVLSRF